MSVVNDLERVVGKPIIQYLQFSVVGAIGVPIDLGIVALTYHVLGAHYLLAQVCGFAVAVTSNFALNYCWTFDQPDGRLLWQYLSYVSVQLTSLGVRVALVTVLVESHLLSVLPATAVGLVVPGLLAFLGVRITWRMIAP